jgi:hypothetical protein
MSYYRLYTLGRADGHFMCADELDAIDDVEAVRMARGMTNGRPMELWCGKRKVKSFPEVQPQPA